MSSETFHKTFYEIQNKKITAMIQSRLSVEISEIIKDYKRLKERVDNFNYNLCGDYKANVMNYGDCKKHDRDIKKLRDVLKYPIK